MFSSIWHTAFFDPIYNTLVYFITVVPGGDAGLAIVLLTIIVKFILLPLSLKAAHTQRAMRELEPTLAEVKTKHKNNREALARETMTAYKTAGVNPFASIILLFIQIPVVIALYLSVFNGGGVRLPEINTALLFSFNIAPEVVNMMFLGFIDIAARNLPLALLAGGTQFIHAQLSLPAPKPKKNKNKPNLKEDLARSMQMQMRYVMPLLIFFIAYTISAAIALYFLVSNIMSIAQEYVVRARVPKNNSTSTKDSNTKEIEESKSTTNS